MKPIAGSILKFGYKITDNVDKTIARECIRRRGTVLADARVLVQGQPPRLMVSTSMLIINGAIKRLPHV